MFESLPFAPRKVEATEARLNRIYEAAKLGLTRAVIEGGGEASSVKVLTLKPIESVSDLVAWAAAKPA